LLTFSLVGTFKYALPISAAIRSRSFNAAIQILSRATTLE
jgi:hypothetical protein